MKFTSRKLLAAALLAAIPMGSAMACTTGNWLGTDGGTPVADGPVGGVAPVAGTSRYSGECGLGATAAGTFVTDNSPEGEGIYRARFYVLTPATGNAVVFGAYADETAGASGGGSPIISVAFSGNSFDFGGSAIAASSIAGITAGRWYSVELLFEAGQADGFSATVQGAGSNTPLTLAPIAAGAGAIGSVSLGLISGTATLVRADAFESTRSADTAIGRLCKGDVNGSNSRTVADAVIIRNEVATQSATLANGQPDVNESGTVTVADAVLTRNLVATGQGACS